MERQGDDSHTAAERGHAADDPWLQNGQASLWLRKTEPLSPRERTIARAVGIALVIALASAWTMLIHETSKGLTPVTLPDWAKWIDEAITFAVVLGIGLTKWRNGLMLLAAAFVGLNCISVPAISFPMLAVMMMALASESGWEPKGKRGRLGEVLEAALGPSTPLHRRLDRRWFMAAGLGAVGAKIDDGPGG